MLTRTGRTEAEAMLQDVCVDQGRRLEDRNRLDTVLVLAVNYADAAGCDVLQNRNLSVWALGIVGSQG